MIKRTVCFQNPAYLSLRQNQMVINRPNDNEEVRTIPVEDLGVVVFDCKQLTITEALLAALLSNNCAVITCDEAHMPIGLNMPLMSNSLQSERFRSQLDASLPLKKQLWQQTIQQKIRNQASLLALHGYETNNMRKWARDVKSGDTENVEGRAAVYYWKSIFAKHVTHFVRGQEEAPPNNLLNYGYAILRAIIARALVGSGLLPTLGIHHHNRYNAYCLADDIMEPYRPYVDQLVLDIMQENVDYQDLSPEIKSRLLTIPTLDVVIGGRKSPLEIAATLTTSSLVKCYDGELRKISYPEM